MSEAKPISVQISYGRNKRGTFVLNGQDISDHVGSVNVEIIACKFAVVTFRLHVDELDADIETVEQDQP